MMWNQEIGKTWEVLMNGGVKKFTRGGQSRKAKIYLAMLVSLEICKGKNARVV
jgi:hypothetical protein